MEQNGQSEPASFFEAPEDSTQERTGFLDDKWNPRDEKIAEIHAELASKTRILPEQVDPQRKLLLENALTKHWTPLPDNDTRRFGAPDAKTEQNFEKAVAQEMERERQVLKKQGLRDDQIATKMDGREQQARERLAKNKKEFFTIRDKPFEAQKGKTNEEVLQDARVAYDEAEQKFKSKLNKLLDDANERTNDEARTAKIQLEKARKTLVQAFTGEDDPELVKKYNEILQMSATRQEAEKKIFEYNMNPSTRVVSEERAKSQTEPVAPDINRNANVEASVDPSSLIPEPGGKYDVDDIYFSPDGTMGHFILDAPGHYVWEPLLGNQERSGSSEESTLENYEWSYELISSALDREAKRLNEVVLPGYFEGAYFSSEPEYIEEELRIFKKQFADQINMSPEDRQKLEQLIAKYEPIVLDVESLLADPNGKSPESQQAFWDKFNEHYDKLMEDDETDLNNSDQSSEKTAAVIGSPYPFIEEHEANDPNVHSYKYFVVQAKMERDRLRDAVSSYLADKNPHSLQQVQLCINSLNQLNTMSVDDPTARSRFEHLKAEYTGLALDVELLLDPDNNVKAEQFWRWFDRDIEKIETNIDSTIDDQYKPWLEKNESDGLDASSERLKQLTEKYPDTALTDETIDTFIADHLIDTSELQSAYSEFNKNPTDENRSKLLAAVDVVGEAYKALPDLTTMPFRESQSELVSSKQGIDYSKGIEKYKGYKDFNKDVQKLLNYALEATGEIPSTVDQLKQTDADDRIKIMNTIIKDKWIALGVAPVDYPSSARDYYENNRQKREGFYPPTSEKEVDEQRGMREEAARKQGKLVRQDREDEYYRQLFANGGVNESEPAQVLELSDNNVDQFVSDHFVDVRDLYQKYQEYRVELEELQRLRKLSREEGSPISESEVDAKKQRVALVAAELTPLVKRIDQERDSGKGLDPSVSIQVANESTAQEKDGRPRTAKKVQALLSYHKQISQLLDYADEAAGEKKSKNKSSINRSSEDAGELLSGIQENVGILTASEVPEEPVVTLQQPIIENLVTETPRPENVIPISPELNAARQELSEVGDVLADIKDTYLQFGLIRDDGTNKLRSLNALRQEVTKLEKSAQSQADNPAYLEGLKNLIPAVEALRYANPDNYRDLERQFSIHLDGVRRQWQQSVVAEYDKEIKQAEEQSNPEDKKLIEVPFEMFKTIVEQELLDYGNDVSFNLRYPTFNDTDKERNRNRRDHLKRVLDNVYVPDTGLTARDRDYLTRVKALYKLITEGDDNTSLLGNKEASDRFRETYFEQRMRLLY